MIDTVTYNGNQYEAAKLNLAKGEGAKITVTTDMLYNLNEAQSSDKVSALIITPFKEGFSVVAKPKGETTLPCQAHIVSKMILKKIKYDPREHIVEPPRQTQFQDNSRWNSRPQQNNNTRTNGQRNNDAYSTNGNYDRRPKTQFTTTPRPQNR